MEQDPPAQHRLAAGAHFSGYSAGPSIHQHGVKGVLAIVIMAFSGYSLLIGKPPELYSDRGDAASLQPIGHGA